MEEHDEDGHDDPISPVNVREQRVAKARRVLGLKSQRSSGDQADQVATNEDRTTDVHKALQILHSREELVIGRALQRLHVNWYHCGTERRLSSFRPAGALARACYLVFPSGASMSSVSTLGTTRAIEQVNV